MCVCVCQVHCSPPKRGALRALHSKDPRKNFGSAEIRTQSCWVGSGNTSSVPCSTPKDSPDGVEDEEELNEDASEWQNSAHDDARDRLKTRMRL